MRTWARFWRIWSASNAITIASRGRWRSSHDRKPSSWRELVSERLALADRLGVVTDASESPFSDELLDRYPVLEERGPDALGVVPFRRATLMEIREGLGGRRAEVVEELQRLRHMGAVM